ncbi:MAG: peptidyl-prolyl cis-trans isomerase [Agathobacter sp.]|nr:peptidyl-prolyl cis-trans isomerase [Agathobacter sp.]
MSIKKFVALLLAGALCLSAFTGCGANPEDTVATLGDETVDYGVANFLVKYQKASVEDMYAMYGMTWSTDLYGNGTTLEDDFKDSAMQLLHDLYTLKNHMDDYGVEITTEDETAIKEAASAFLAANSESAIAELGASQQIVEEVLTLYTIQAKMYNAIVVDADTNVSDEEANMRGYSLVTINIDGEYDESYQFVEYTDAEVAVLKETAKELADQVATKTLEEAAEGLGYTATASAYKKGDTTIDKTLLSAMDSLKEGEVSGVIETETALYVARIDADTDKDATESNRQSIIAQREAELYEKVLTAWQENDGWTVDESVVAKIDFHNVFTQIEESTEDIDNTESE